MSGPVKRRVRRLERGTNIALPHHLRPDRWTDEQLHALICEFNPDWDPTCSDEDLRKLADAEDARAKEQSDNGALP